jgi:hypothetical protein
MESISNVGIFILFSSKYTKSAAGCTSIYLKIFTLMVTYLMKFIDYYQIIRMNIESISLESLEMLCFTDLHFILFLLSVLVSTLFFFVSPQ